MTSDIIKVPRGITMHNTRQRDYKNGTHKITVASRNVYREGVGKLWRRSAYQVNESKPQNSDNEARNDSMRRARDKVYDIIAMNPDIFEYFVTLTIDPKKVNSRSADEVKRCLRHFLKNAVSRHNLAYVLVPEYHKDGKIHLHGFFNDGLPLVESGTYKARGYEKPMKAETLKRKGISPEDCRTVYNIPQWKYGFTTAVKIDDSNRGTLEGYITKYITKDLSKIFGHFYYAGGDIERTPPEKRYDTDYDSFEGDSESYCEAIHTHFKYLTIKDN